MLIIFITISSKLQNISGDDLGLDCLAWEKISKLGKYRIPTTSNFNKYQISIDIRVNKYLIAIDIKFQDVFSFKLYKNWDQISISLEFLLLSKFDEKIIKIITMYLQLDDQCSKQ